MWSQTASTSRVLVARRAPDASFAAGTRTLRITLRRGTYRVTVTATNAGGTTTIARTLKRRSR